MHQYNFLNQNRLTSAFFDTDTLTVAQKFLGKFLVVKNQDKIQVGQIIETEAYIGTDDLACHAAKGKTPRNQIMWQKPGTIYVYLVYGIYNLLNIITEPKGTPAGVLIRSLKPIQNIDIKTDGPGKICKALNLTRQNTGSNILNDFDIFIADLGQKPKSIISLPRVGIDYAGEPWVSKPWRFKSPPPQSPQS